MADIKNITIDGTTYDLKDAKAREDVSDLKEDITDNFNSIMTGDAKIFNANSPINWEQQGINASSGINEDTGHEYQARLKLSDAIYSNYDISVKSLASGFYLYFYKYSDAECTQFLGELSQILNYQGVTEVTLQSGYYYRIKGVFTPTTTMTAEKIAELCSKFEATSATKIKENAEKIDDLDAEYDARITVVEGDINDINSAYYLIYGANRNPNNNSNGYLDSSGNLTEYSNWVTTDYCYVADLEKIKAAGENLNTQDRETMALNFMCSYDADKHFIEQVYTSGQMSYTLDEDVAYVRVCYRSGTFSEVMVGDYGTLPSEFVSYQTQLKLKNEYFYCGSCWHGKKWAAIGDSVTESNNRTLENYHGFVAETTGIHVTNMGSSGTGYKNAESENKAFYQRILNVPLDTDVVTIFGSGNDMQYVNSALGDITDTTTDTLCGCINKTIDNLYSILPTVKLGIVTPCPWAPYPPSDENNLMARYSAKIVELCKSRGIPCLDLYHCSTLRPWDASYRAIVYSRDSGDGGAHPNEIGHEIIASHFKDFLNSLIL